MSSRFDIVVIGSGPAGHTAALYARRSGRSVCMVRGYQPGGQLTTTSTVENWPGDLSVGGFDLIARMMAQLDELGVTSIEDEITTCSTRDDGIHCLGTSGGVLLEAAAVVIATGARSRWLGVPGEEELKNRGISGCAVCDGFLFRDRGVTVIGGGNSAVEEAIFLSSLCRSVTLVHRGDRLRAERVLQDRLFACSNVEVLWNTKVKAFCGVPELEAIIVESADDGEREIATQGAFVAIGHDPATSAFRGWVSCDRDGYVEVRAGTTLTDRAGVFAAGDVMDKIYRQAVTSAGTGCMAALDAERYLTARSVSGSAVGERK